jgi:hypothetical protein
VIATGLKAGDRVITEIPQALETGATVRLAGQGGDQAGKAKGKGKGKGEKGKGAAKDAASE